VICGHRLKWYERESDRLFSTAVFKAELSDIEFAGAFLLGVDVRAIATDRDIIARSLSQVQPKIDDAPVSDLDGTRYCVVPAADRGVPARDGYRRHSPLTFGDGAGPILATRSSLAPQLFFGASFGAKPMEQDGIYGKGVDSRLME